MNIKLLQTRLNSLDHYQSEIDKLQEALRLTQSTRQDILKSMVEFCDLTEGDLFIADGTFYKFISVDHSYEDGSNEKRISLKIKVETQVAKYHGVEWVNSDIYLPLEKVVAIKSLGNFKEHK